MKKCYLLSIVTFLVFSLFLGTIVSNAQNDDFAMYASYEIPVRSWDPSIEYSNGIITLCNIYETLLRYDPLEDKFIKILATDYTASSDGLTWTFHLRKGVKFHDETDFNAKAVKFSIERTMRINKGAAYIWEPVDEINVVDDYTVEFKLKHPAPLDLICSSTYAAFIMSPTALMPHPDKWLSENEGFEAGTGPYKLESYQEERHEAVLTWFKEYWGGWEEKQFKKVVIKTIREPATRELLIKSGEADFTMELPIEDVDALQDDENVNVVIGPSFQNTNIMLNSSYGPLSNKKVRQALSYAFPYQDVISYCMKNYARQSVGPIPYGLWGHSEELFQYKHDLNKAKQLLEEAGYAKDGFKIYLNYVSSREAQRKLAQLYKAELAKLNIDLEIRGQTVGTIYALARTPINNKQDLMVWIWWPDYASPQGWLVPLYYSEEEPSTNFTCYKNKEYDSLVDKAFKESAKDKDKAANTYAEAQKILIDDAVAIWVCDHKAIYYTSKSFKGYKDNPIYPNVVFFYDTYREK